MCSTTQASQVSQVVESTSSPALPGAEVPLSEPWVQARRAARRQSIRTPIRSGPDRRRPGIPWGREEPDGSATMGTFRGPVKRLVRRALQVVATRVGQDGLFEQRGERPPADPMAPLVPAEPVPSTAPPAAQQAAHREPASAGDAVALPATGYVVAHRALILQAHGPGPRPRVVNHWATWCVPVHRRIASPRGPGSRALPRGRLPGRVLGSVRSAWRRGRDSGTRRRFRPGQWGPLARSARNHAARGAVPDTGYALGQDTADLGYRRVW